MEEGSPHQYTSTTIFCSIQYILSLTTYFVRIYRVAKSLVNVFHSIKPFNRKKDFLILVDLIYCESLNNCIYIYYRRHIMYAIIKQWIYIVHEIGKLMKTIDIYIHLYGSPESQMHNNNKNIYKLQTNDLSFGWYLSIKDCFLHLQLHMLTYFQNI